MRHTPQRPSGHPGYASVHRRRSRGCQVQSLLRSRGPVLSIPDRSRSLPDDDHVQVARTVHALDPVELDVAGGRRSADPGLRTLRVEEGHGLGYVGDDLVLADHTDVAVRHEGDRATTLSGAVVEDDGSGLGDADARLRDDGVDPVELGRAQPVVDDGSRNLEAESPSGTTTEWPDARLRRGRSARPAYTARPRRGSRPPVPRTARSRPPPTTRAPVARERRLRRSRSAPARGSPPEHEVSRVPPSVRFHQARKDSFAGTGSSRAPGPAAAARRPALATQHPAGETGEALGEPQPAGRREGGAGRLHRQRLRFRHPVPAVGIDDLRAQVHQHLGDVDAHRADLEAGTAQGRRVGQRVDLPVLPHALEQRVQDRPDRTRVDRAVGVPAHAP